MKIGVVENNPKLQTLYVDTLKRFGYEAIPLSLDMHAMTDRHNLDEKSITEDRVADSPLANLTDEIVIGMKFILIGHNKNDSIQETVSKSRIISQLYNNAKIIVLSTEASVKKDVIVYGFGFLLKPFTMSDLLDYLTRKYKSIFH